MLIVQKNTLGHYACFGVGYVCAGRGQNIVQELVNEKDGTTYIRFMVRTDYSLREHPEHKAEYEIVTCYVYGYDRMATIYTLAQTLTTGTRVLFVGTLRQRENGANVYLEFLARADDLMVYDPADAVKNQERFRKAKDKAKKDDYDF